VKSLTPLPLSASRSDTAIRTLRRRLGVRRRQLVQFLWLGLDGASMAVAGLLTAQLLRIDLTIGAASILGLIIAVRLAAFVRVGMYRSVLRYSGLHTLTIASLGVALGTGVGVAATFFLHWENAAGLGPRMLILEGLASLAVCGATRVIARIVLERQVCAVQQRALIYGAGDLGELTMRNLRRLGSYRPVGFLDDDRHKHRAIIHGRSVLGGLKDLDAVVATTRPEAVVLAVSNPPQALTRALFQACMNHHLRLLVVHGVKAAQAGAGELSLKDIALEDLLARPSRHLDHAPVQSMFAGKTVLVTGAGGSIGSELTRQIAGCGIESLLLLDHSEFNLYAIHGEICARYPNLRVVPILSNLTCAESITEVMAAHQPQVVIHAAAYKHVPLVEENPFVGLANNVGGFRNLLLAADRCGVERLVLISTDKAVRPTNVMGASKRVCELLLQNFPTRTRVCAVRFGNVLGSSGSVVPRFLEQIRAGGPVTVTHPDITRYFMLIHEAAALVLQAGALARHGEIFILDMGAPVRIADMARQLIWMTGRVPDRDIAVTFTGLRPGEKLYEELLISNSEQRTAVDGIMVARPTEMEWERLEDLSDRLLAACARRDHAGFVLALATLVPEWAPSDAYRRWLPQAQTQTMEAALVALVS